MSDEAKKAQGAAAEDDRRRYEMTVEAVRRGIGYHSAVWDADQAVRDLRSKRERDELEALRLANLPEHEWPAEMLVAELDRQRAENARLNASYEDLSRRYGAVLEATKAEGGKR